jgi:hypothetical protein
VGNKTKSSKAWRKYLAIKKKIKSRFYLIIIVILSVSGVWGVNI